MDMFSEELRILDRNTVEYMVDQMQNTIDEQKKELASKDLELKSKDDVLAAQKLEIIQLRELLAAKEK